MIRCEVVEKFTLKKFNELQNIERFSKEHEDKKYNGYLFAKDKFECSQEMAEYLTGNNPLKKQVVRIIEVQPEKEEKPEIQITTETTPEKPKATKKKKSSKK